MSDEAWLSIGDITAVTIGRSTRVLQKNSGKDKDASAYVSIVTSGRSLDMQVGVACLCFPLFACNTSELQASNEAERDYLANGFSAAFFTPGLLHAALIQMFTSPQSAAQNGGGEVKDPVVPVSPDTGDVAEEVQLFQRSHRHQATMSTDQSSYLGVNFDRLRDPREGLQTPDFAR
jgi:hypothetical protein